MAGADGARDQKAKPMRRIPSVRAVVAMLSWSLLVGMGGLGLGFVFYATGGGLGGPAGQELITQGHAIIVGAAALTLAPWLIAGVRWWRSGRPSVADNRT